MIQTALVPDKLLYHLTEMSVVASLYESLACAEENDQLVTARFYYEEILKSEPENTALSVLYAANLIELGDFLTAESVLSPLAERLDEETRPGYYIQLGFLAKEHGDLAQAEEYFREAWKAQPEDGEPLLLAAAMASGQREIARAEYLTREAIRLPETAVEGGFFLGNLLAGQQRYEEAREAFKKVLEAEAYHEVAEEWLEDIEQVIELKNTSVS